MPHTLIVAEKPSVARDIARVLGAKTKQEGCLVSDRWVITGAIGHLVALCEPEELNPALKKWAFNTLPILPDQMKTKVMPKTRAQYQVVRTLMNSPDTERIVCATDSGREGELIFRYIYAQARCKKPVMRLWISSLTDEAIRAGLAAMKPASAYDALYESARCRSEADWLVGMNASRAFTLRFDALLSVGRVQTPTLKLLVAREKEIRAFQPKPYFEIDADFGDYTGKWLDEKANLTRTEDEALARRIADAVRGQAARVERSDSTPKSMPPPKLYDLTTLQREANKLLGLSAATTLTAAQALYETHKLITYPRTDSRALPRSMAGQCADTLGKLCEPYAPLAQPLAGKLPHPVRVFDDAGVTDHHAIIPTPKTAALDKLPPRERGLYDMIARRFIAVFYPDYRYLQKVVITRCQGHGFISRGNEPTQMGWRAVYADVKKPKDAAKDEDDQSLPALRVGDERIVKRCEVTRKMTRPPAPHTDATLLGAMEHADTRVRSPEAEDMEEAEGGEESAGFQSAGVMATRGAGEPHRLESAGGTASTGAGEPQHPESAGGAASTGAGDTHRPESAGGAASTGVGEPRRPESAGGAASTGAGEPRRPESTGATASTRSGDTHRPESAGTAASTGAGEPHRPESAGGAESTGASKASHTGTNQAARTTTDPAARAKTEQQLRRAQAAHGLGTPATRAAIIERLIQVGYVTRKGKALTPTEKGEKLIDVAPDEIASPEITGKWEAALYHMAQAPDAAAARALSERFMQGIRRFASFLVDSARTSAAEVTFPKEERDSRKRGKAHAGKLAGATPHKCPLCGQGQVTENSRAFGCSRWKEGCAFTVWKDALARQGLGEVKPAHMKTLLSGKELKLTAHVAVLESGVLKIRPT